MPKLTPEERANRVRWQTDGSEAEIAAEIRAALAEQAEEHALLKAEIAARDANAHWNCAQCGSLIVSVDVVQHETHPTRKRIVWTCCNGCSLDKQPFQWTDFLDEALDTAYAEADQLRVEHARELAQARADAWSDAAMLVASYPLLVGQGGAVDALCARAAELRGEKP